MDSDSTLPKAYLFDIGNVLIDIDLSQAFKVWSAAADVSVDILRNRFVMDDAYRDFEIGRVNTDEYMNKLRQMLDIDIDDSTLLEGWNAILRDKFPELRVLLQQLRHIAPVYVFSNTNAAHQKLWSVTLADTLELCTDVFTSWEIGLRKPDVESFLHVARRMQTVPEDILFFDDSIENICGAQTAGMQTVHVTQVNDTLQAVASALSRSTNVKDV